MGKMDFLDVKMTTFMGRELEYAISALVKQIPFRRDGPTNNLALCHSGFSK